MIGLLAMVAVGWTIETAGDGWAAGGKGDGVFADGPSCFAAAEAIAKKNPAIKKAYCLLHRDPNGDGDVELRVLVVDR